MRADPQRSVARGWAGYGLSILACAVGAGLLWSFWVLLAFDPATQPAGPLLAQARQKQVLRIAVRSYPRPTFSNAAMVSEPDEMDRELATSLGRYLGVTVHLTALPAEDIARFLLKGEVDAVIVGSLDVPGLTNQRAALSELPASYRVGALVALRNDSRSAGAGVSGQTVCVAFGSPWAAALQRQGANLKTYPSSIRATTAFIAGDCGLLADERNVLKSLLQQPDWRFYRMLPKTLEASADAQVYLAQPDRKSLKLVQAGLRDWQERGGQAKAWDLRSNAIMLDSLKISDGLVCH
jgi:polar amino acid transport system substrate-binding protein